MRHHRNPCPEELERIFVRRAAIAVLAGIALGMAALAVLLLS